MKTDTGGNWLTYLALGGALLAINEFSKSGTSQQKEVTLNDKITRKILSVNIKGLGNINVMELSLPMYDISYFKQTDLPLIRAKIDSIRNAYSKEISLASQLTNVPDYIILATIYNESGGNKSAKSSSGAIGLMQIKPQTANDTIFLENKQKRLTDVEKTVLKNSIGQRLDAIFKMQYLSHKLSVNNFTGNVITANDMMDPMFNILTGSMLLGILIDQEKDKNGSLRIDKAFLRYNKGYFYKPKGNTFAETLNSQARGSEAQAYLLKMCGKNGLLDILTA